VHDLAQITGFLHKKYIEMPLYKTRKLGMSTQTRPLATRYYPSWYLDAQHTENPQMRSKMTLVQNTTVDIDMRYFCQLCEFQPVNRGKGVNTPPPKQHAQFLTTCTTMACYVFPNDVPITQSSSCETALPLECRRFARALCFSGFRPLL